MPPARFDVLGPIPVRKGVHAHNLEGVFPCIDLVTLLLVAACALLPDTIAAAQDVTGALIGTVQDAQGARPSQVQSSVSARQALIGGPVTVTTNEQGRLRFPALPPGLYVLDIEAPGIRGLSRSGYPHRRRRHDRENGGSQGGGHRGIAGRRRSGLTYRSARQRIRDPLRPRRPQSDPCAAIQHVRLHQGRAWRVAHLAGKRSRPTACPRSAPAPTRTLPHRRHELHLSVQRRSALRAGCRLHSGSASAVCRRIGRVRQHAGRRRQRHHEAGRRSLCCLMRRITGSQPAFTSQPVQRPICAVSRERVRARPVSRLHDEPRRPGCSRSAVVLWRDTSICATTTVSRAPTQDSHGPTSRTKSSRSSRGGSPPACS